MKSSMYVRCRQFTVVCGTPRHKTLNNGSPASTAIHSSGQIGTAIEGMGSDRNTMKESCHTDTNVLAPGIAGLTWRGHGSLRLIVTVI